MIFKGLVNGQITTIKTKSLPFNKGYLYGVHKFDKFEELFDYLSIFYKQLEFEGYAK